MSSSLFTIGLTGLNAAQAALVTTSHNISNAGTAGFSRQATVQSTNPAMFSGSGFFGEGVKVDTIKRAYDSFLNSQVLSADTKYNEYKTYNTEISQVDNMLADSSVGLEPAVDSFFQGVQEVAANPSSIPARQAMISSGQSLVDRFQNLSNQLNGIRDGVEGQIRDTVTAISTYAKEIAGVNQQIANVQQAGSAQPANDLLDKRDQLVKELNQLVRVSTTTASDGSMSVFIGSGQPLVIGNTATNLVAQTSSTDLRRNNVAVLTQSGAAVSIPESLLSGGKLGGLLAMRSEALDKVQNQLGLVAVGMSTAFNAQHALGQDLNGNIGSNFFTKPSVTVLADAKATTQAPTVTYSNVSQLTGDDYRLMYDSTGAPNLTRLSDGAPMPFVTTPVVPATVPPTVTGTAGGLNITVAATGTPGDSFLIEPTRDAAANINVAISDTRLIAAAAPVTSSAATSNLGTASITAPVVSSTASLGLVPPVFPTTLTFSGGNLSGFPAGQSVTAVTAAGVSTTYAAPATVPYSSGMTLSFGGVSFTMNGVPQSNDKFTLALNTNGVADSRNIVALGNLQTTKTLLSANGQPSATFQSVYAQLVSTVGNKTREVSVNSDAQKSLVDQATQTQQSLVGVNLDEEAANLIRYQQAYQAAGKVMSIASKLFDQVLAMGQ